MYTLVDKAFIKISFLLYALLFLFLFLGPLCPLPQYECQNGGLCQEDRIGNSTTCACPTGFTGTVCQVSIDASFCDNADNPCQVC